jgi:hypothetical protein
MKDAVSVVEMGEGAVFKKALEYSDSPYLKSKYPSFSDFVKAV